MGQRALEGAVVTRHSSQPIVIADYDPHWPRHFEAERDLIVRACGPEAFVAIEHIGSTAVPGLAAKPIIDIMAGVRALNLVTGLIGSLGSIGYQYVPEYEVDMPERRYFRKDVGGRRAFHLHVVEHGGEFWERHLLFRDFLRTHPDAARAYERLKRALAAEYSARSDRAGYTEAKTDFIRAIEEQARAEAERRRR